MTISQSNFTIDLLVNGNPIKSVLHQGNYWIEGRPGSEYSIKIKNQSSQRKLFVVSIDGLSVMDGKPASHGSSGYVVDAYGTVEIPGWLLDNATAAKFEFGGVGKNETYVEKLKNMGLDVDPSNQGIIGVAVFNEKQPYYLNQKTNRSGYSWNLKDLPIAMSSSVRSMNDLGTKFGEETKFDTVKTYFEKSSKTPNSVVNIRYNTLEILKKLGVPIHGLTINTPIAFPAENDYCMRPR